MCLDLKRNSIVEKATKAITVYKALDFNMGMGVTPYRRTKYYFGDLMKVPYFTGGCKVFVSKLPINITSVDKGLHSYLVNKRNMWTDLVVECTIPKGTYFIRGRDNEVVSLKLKVSKAIRGLKTDIDRFNSKRRPKGKSNVLQSKKS